MKNSLQSCPRKGFQCCSCPLLGGTCIGLLWRPSKVPSTISVCPWPLGYCWVCWVIEPKQQESLRSSGDPLRSCLLFWATLKSHGVWTIVIQQSEGMLPPESREPHSAVGRDKSNHFFFPWKCHWGGRPLDFGWIWFPSADTHSLPIGSEWLIPPAHLDTQHNVINMVRLFWCHMGKTSDQISMNWVVAQSWRISIALEVEKQENCFFWSLRKGIEIKAFVRSVAAQARMALWHLLKQLLLEPQLDWVCDPPVTCLRTATLSGVPRVSSVVSNCLIGSDR